MNIIFLQFYSKFFEVAVLHLISSIVGLNSVDISLLS